MIRILCKNEVYTYDMYHITKAFLPEAEIKTEVHPGQESLAVLKGEDDSCLFVVIEDSPADMPSEKKRMAGRKLYQELVRQTGKTLPWGILTGIRPTKLILQKIEAGYSDEETKKFIKECYYAQDDRIDLGMQIAKREQELLKNLDYQQGYSLYIGIPFCPTTCSYCSFTSYPIGAWRERVDDYLAALYKEIAYAGAACAGKKLNTIYIGGGTPTTLTPKQLDGLLTHLRQTFSYDDLQEMTVEAGRPDSIDADKLRVLAEHDVERISINPQTMQQKTLDIIGRKHTVNDVVQIYHTARELGFQNINMDLIAGLPGETAADMADTLAQIEILKPDSLTVHSLAIKRAARLNMERRSDTAGAKELSEMIALAEESAGRMNLLPYYLYRQKNIAGSFENVGYAKVDKAGIYNILIMEEKQTILALGAGATTKALLSKEMPAPGSKRGKMAKIVRIENVKGIDDYIQRIDEMIERKEEWLWR